MSCLYEDEGLCSDCLSFFSTHMNFKEMCQPLEGQTRQMKDVACMYSQCCFPLAHTPHSGVIFLRHARVIIDGSQMNNAFSFLPAALKQELPHCHCVPVKKKKKQNSKTMCFSHSDGFPLWPTIYHVTRRHVFPKAPAVASVCMIHSFFSSTIRLHRLLPKIGRFINQQIVHYLCN